MIEWRNDMLAKLKQLLSEYPEIDTAAMGFPVGWEQELSCIAAGDSVQHFSWLLAGLSVDV